MDILSNLKLAITGTKCVICSQRGTSVQNAFKCKSYTHFHNDFMKKGTNPTKSVGISAFLTSKIGSVLPKMDGWRVMFRAGFISGG